MSWLSRLLGNRNSQVTDHPQKTGTIIFRDGIVMRDAETPRMTLVAIRKSMVDRILEGKSGSQTYHTAALMAACKLADIGPGQMFTYLDDPAFKSMVKPEPNIAVYLTGITDIDPTWKGVIPGYLVTLHRST